MHDACLAVFESHPALCLLVSPAVAATTVVCLTSPAKAWHEMRPEAHPAAATRSALLPPLSPPHRSPFDHSPQPVLAVADAAALTSSTGTIISGLWKMAANRVNGFALARITESHLANALDQFLDKYDLRSPKPGCASEANRERWQPGCAQRGAHVAVIHGRHHVVAGGTANLLVERGAWRRR